MAHKISENITFDGLIDKETFIKLLDTILTLDSINTCQEYNEESEDGFQDLYNYWLNDSTMTIEEKIEKNLETINKS